MREKKLFEESVKERQVVTRLNMTDLKLKPVEGDAKIYLSLISSFS